MNFIKKCLNKTLLWIIRFINHINSIYFNSCVNPDDIYHIINKNLNKSIVLPNARLEQYILNRLCKLVKDIIIVIVFIILGLLLINYFLLLILISIPISLYLFICHLKSKLGISFNKSKCFMIEGPWGIGKTYTFNTRIKPELAKLFKNIYYVSLSGLKTQDEIRAKIISKYKILKNYHFIFFVLGVSFFILWLFAFVNTKDSLALYNQCDNCLIISFNYFPNFISNKIIELWPYIGTLIKIKYLESIIQIVLWITIVYWILYLLGYKFLISFISALSRKHFGFDIDDEKLDLIFIESKDTLLVFDDLERVAKDADIKSILGFIGNLKEVYGFNIILICNEVELIKLYEKDNNEKDNAFSSTNQYKLYYEKFIDKKLSKDMEEELEDKLFADEFGEDAAIIKNIVINKCLHKIFNDTSKTVYEQNIKRAFKNIRFWQKFLDKLHYMMSDLLPNLQKSDDYILYNNENDKAILCSDLEIFIKYMLFFSFEYTTGLIRDKFSEYVDAYKMISNRDKFTFDRLKLYGIYINDNYIQDIFLFNLAYDFIYFDNIGTKEDFSIIIMNRLDTIFKILSYANSKLSEEDKQYFMNNLRCKSNLKYIDYYSIVTFTKNNKLSDQDKNDFINTIEEILDKSDISIFYDDFKSFLSIPSIDQEFTEKIINKIESYINNNDNRIEKTKNFIANLDIYTLNKYEYIITALVSDKYIENIGKYRLDIPLLKHILTIISINGYNSKFNDYLVSLRGKTKSEETINVINEFLKNANINKV